MQPQASQPRCYRCSGKAALALLGFCLGEDVPSEALGAGPLAEPSRRWRLVALDSVIGSWTVGELRFFSDTNCQVDISAVSGGLNESAGLHWKTIASGHYGHLPARAFDGKVWTEWQSHCYVCDKEEAWIGLEFSKPVMVYCVKLWQWGTDGSRATAVRLERWADTPEWQLPPAPWSGRNGSAGYPWPKEPEENVSMPENAPTPTPAGTESSNNAVVNGSGTRNGSAAYPRPGENVSTPENAPAPAPAGNESMVNGTSDNSGSPVAPVAGWRPVLLATGLDANRWDQFRFIRCNELEVPEYRKMEITNNGFYPSEATLTCTGARIPTGSNMRKCRPDGTWDGGTIDCWPLLDLIVLVTIVVVLDITAFSLYYLRVVLPKPPALTAKAYVPTEFMRKWNTDLMTGVGEHRRSSRRMAWAACLACPCCRLADSWHTSGQLRYSMSAVLTHVCCICLPCVAGIFRGFMRGRFLIPGIFFRDICTWIWCPPCAAIQEAEHCDSATLAASQELEIRHRAEEEQRHAVEGHKKEKADLEANSGAPPWHRKWHPALANNPNVINMMGNAPPQLVLGAS